MKNILQKIKYPAISIFLLLIGFLVCRYPLFNLHGMNQFQLILFVVGIVVILISAIFDGRKIMIFTVLGYFAGFIMGAIFQVDWIDSHNTAMNNFWIWFVGVMLASILIGIVWEIIAKVINHKKVAKTNN